MQTNTVFREIIENLSIVLPAGTFASAKYLLSFGKGNGDGSALSFPALKGQSAAVKRKCMLDDCKSQTSAAHLSAAALVHPEEALENT